MLKRDVRTLEAALAYMVDCTLATVADMRMKKSSPKGELSRQIEIAQTGVNWMRDFEVNPQGTRAAEVLDKFSGNVCAWALQYKP